MYLVTVKDYKMYSKQSCSREKSNSDNQSKLPSDFIDKNLKRNSPKYINIGRFPENSFVWKTLPQHC